MATIRWHIGDHVRVRGRRWSLRGVATWPDCTELRLASALYGACSLLAPFDRPLATRTDRRPKAVYPRRGLHTIRRAVAAAVPFGGAIAAARASVRLLPHQLEPLLAMVRYGITRILIADAVGLGKTIQAGLMLLELAAREVGFRALLLVPAGLRAQWRHELAERFELAVEDADAEWLRRAAADRPPDVNPWSLPGIHLTSIDFAKRPEVLRALEHTAWDLVVVDEAHLVCGASDRRRAAHALASRSRRVVLLTATPDTGDGAAFSSLCRIGMLDPGEPPIVMFRRARHDVMPSVSRRSVLLRVQPSPAEARMHALLDRYSRRVWSEASARRDASAKLATVVLRKRALSSATSLAISAARRQQLLAGVAVAAEHQLLLPLADEDPLPDAVQDDDLAAPGLADVRRERRWLAAIVEAARLAARAETKARRLVRLLSRVGEPVIVFTEYRDTLHRLEHLLLAAGRRVEVLHGGMDRRERERVQRAFNQGGRLLLATDAASEGLNLHHPCRIVIHYELPWRPARIEQRAGRVDRLGQTRRVHEVALVAAGTAERLVLAPLLARAARARAAGGAAAGLLDSLSETAVSELVMGGDLPEPPQVAPTTREVGTLDLRWEATAEAARLEATRAAVARSPPRREQDEPVVFRLRVRRSTLTPGLIAVFRLSFAEHDGRAVHEECVAVCLEEHAAAAGDRDAASLTALAERLRHSSAEPGSLLHSRLTRLLAAGEDAVAAMRRGAWQQPSERDEAIRRTQPSAAMEMVQAGLFDRRALAARARTQAARGALLDAVDARQQSRSGALHAGVELVAVISLVRRRR